MTLKEKLAALAAEAKELRTKANDKPEEFTDQDASRATELAKEYSEVQGKIDQQAAATKALDGLADTSTVEQPEAPEDKGAAKSGTLGERFVKSEAYRGFRKAHPTGVGRDTPISIKAHNVGPTRMVKADPLNTEQPGNARAVRTDEVDDLVYRPEAAFLNLITNGTTNLPWFQYRQVVDKTNNAKIVPEAKSGANSASRKPISKLSTQTADAKAYTYADGMEVTNQELSDDGIIQSLIDSTLTSNLELAIEDKILNGEGGADEPTGLFNLTGVLQQDFDTDIPKTLRKSITKLRKNSADIQAVLLNPEDDETWDLLKDKNDRYLGGGPFATAPATSWGHRRLTSQALEPGTAVLGQFSTAQLLILEALSILAFNQHKDYAQHNLTYVRAELRATQLFREPAKLCIVDLNNGSGGTESSTS